MICPYCKVEIQLTWKKYFLAPFGKYLCPSCLKNSRLRSKSLLRGFLHIMRMILVSVFIIVIFLKLISDKRIAMNLAIAIGIVAVILMDKWHDGNYKILKKYQI